MSSQSNKIGIDYEDDISREDLDKDVREILDNNEIDIERLRVRIAAEELGLPEERASVIGGNDFISMVNNCRYLKRLLRDKYGRESKMPYNLAKPPRAGTYTPPNAWELFRAEAKSALRGKK